MERKRIICLVLFVVLILVLSSCHPRHVSDIKLAMTKEEVISLWGPTNRITYKTANGTTLETWEYHFATSDSVCWITFIQDRVTANPQCDSSPAGGWYFIHSQRGNPILNHIITLKPITPPITTHTHTTTVVIIVTTALITTLTTILITVIGGNNRLACPYLNSQVRPRGDNEH